MRLETPTASYPRFSRSQFIWAVLGLAVLVITAVLAANNFEAIYNVQKDFVVGSLLSLTGFCFGRALSRTEEQRALELIRTAPTERVREALKTEEMERLHDEGVFQELSLLAQNLEAAEGRLAEYYDAESRRLDFYRYLPILRVVFINIDHARANIVAIEEALGPGSAIQRGSDSPEEPRRPGRTPDERLDLTSIQRNLRESLERRNQAYEWLSGHAQQPLTQEFWDVFATMTSDALKADRLLATMLGQYIPASLDRLRTTTVDYLGAAIARAEESTQILGALGTEEPKVFEVMKDDLENAREALKPDTFGRRHPASADRRAGAVNGD